MNRIQTYNINKIRQDFPILNEKIHKHSLAYLDNANTTQKPKQVIDALNHYYQHDNSNVHRAVHLLGERATHAFEQTRKKIRDFINAADTSEIVFLRGTTEAINLVANSYGRSHLKAGDEILISTMEHHSNIVPWQLLCEQIGTILKVIPITDAGEIELETYKNCITDKTRLIAVTHISNALGTINPIKDMIRIAHDHEIPILIDGAQGTPHIRVDVQDLDCDFYAFSGHKMYGPTGIGALYAKKHFLEAMPPYHGGGEMISQVSFEKTTFNKIPYKFEAGTPNIADAIALGTTIDYLNSIGIDTISAYEHDLLHYATEAVNSIPGLQIIGTASYKCSVISFTMKEAHPHDIGTILDHHGIAIRAGHHCAMPLMERFNVPATARVSLGMYNTREEIDRLIKALEDVRRIFG